MYNTHCRDVNQWFFFSRYIGLVTPKIIYVQYLQKYILDQTIQKIFHLILKTEALMSTPIYIFSRFSWSTLLHPST